MPIIFFSTNTEINTKIYYFYAYTANGTTFSGREKNYSRYTDITVYSVRMRKNCRHDSGELC